MDGIIQKQVQSLDNGISQYKENERSLYNPGDMVLVKAIRNNIPTLTPIWEGPYSVMFSSPTTLKVMGIGTQIHHTWIKTWNPSGENQEGHPTSPEESSQYSEY